MELERQFMFENTGLTWKQEKKSVTQAGPKCPIQENSYLSKEKSHIHILVLPS